MGVPNHTAAIQTYRVSKHMRGVKHMAGVQTYGGCPDIPWHPNMWGSPNLWGSSKHMGVSKHEGYPYMLGCPNILGASKHMQVVSKQMGHPNIGVSKYVASKHRDVQTWGASKHTGGIQTYGVVQAYGGHPNIQVGIQAYWGDPNIEGAFLHAFLSCKVGFATNLT